MQAPQVGEWYTDLIGGQVFEIVAEDEQGVGVQYIDGALGELELDTWHSLFLAPTAPPRDWAALYEIAPEDVHYDDFRVAGKTDPLCMLEPQYLGEYEGF